VQTGAVVAAKSINKTLLGPEAIMTEVNIMKNLKHPVLIQPTQLYETNGAYVIMMPL